MAETSEQHAIVCQCTKCNHVFDYDKKVQSEFSSGVDSYRCPKCKGRYRIIKHKNKQDEHYLEFLGRKTMDY